MDQVQAEISQLKALIEKQQDVLLQFMQQTNSKVEDVFKYLKSKVSTVLSAFALDILVMQQLATADTRASSEDEDPGNEPYTSAGDEEHPE